MASSTPQTAATKMALEGMRINLVRMLIEEGFATRPPPRPERRTLLRHAIDLEAVGTDDVLTI